MAHDPSEASERSTPLTPAPYGQACVGCARAKCKCFYQSEGSKCERCHRLGRSCEPSSAARKRKAQTQLPVPPPPPPPPSSSRLEEKLDDLVSLLRSQAAERQAQTLHSPQSIPLENSTPRSLGASHGYQESMSTPARDPDLVINTNSSVVHLLRPAHPDTGPSPIRDDVDIHQFSDALAEESLAIFRQVFLSTFPFIHIPVTMTAAGLHHQKPFLWLVVMALTTKSVTQQFAMEDTIWGIISRRIVTQHLADLDLLLGVVCFASWSHYFKTDKPFMSMLSQLAVSLAFELCLQKDAPTTNKTRRSASGQLRAREPPMPQPRTIDERRAILAVFHLASSTWTAYRKTEPFRWTPYMDRCLRIVGEGGETQLDMLLATQVKCQIITNQLTSAFSDDAVESESPESPPRILVTAFLAQLNDIRQSLPAPMVADRTAQFYLHSTELTVRASLLSRPPVRDATGLSNLNRLQDLESTLASAERWLALLFEMPLANWIGISVDTFAQLTHTLVVLFRLANIDEPGWDLNEVRRRADVFDVLDRSCDMIDSIPETLGIMDAAGPRRGLFFKTTYLLRAIKILLLGTMTPAARAIQVQSDTSGGGQSNEFTGDTEQLAMADDFSFNLSNEPWFSEILGPAWDSRPEVSYFTPFAT